MDEGWTASRVAAAFDVSERTVRRAKRRYSEEGLEEVLRHHRNLKRTSGQLTYYLYPKGAGLRTRPSFLPRTVSRNL